MNELIDMVLGYLRGIWRSLVVCLADFCDRLGWYFYATRSISGLGAGIRGYLDHSATCIARVDGGSESKCQNARVELIARTLFSRPNLEKIAQITGLDVQSKDSEAMERLLRR